MQTKVNITSVAFAPLWGSGTTILRELVYDTSSGSKVLTYALYYGYDEVGAISYVTVKSGTASATFYYVKNLQGDVVAITDSSGTGNYRVGMIV